MDAAPIRIVLLGKTGTGKSSLAKTLSGEQVFDINHTANPGTSACQKATKHVNGRLVTLIDTPGFFDRRTSDEDLRSEIAKCITECSPGPHAFFILLKVEKFTEHENQVISRIQEVFTEEAFKYAVVVFTHGDQLPEEMNIEEFSKENEDLCALVKKCGDRRHVIDNKYWTNNQQDGYRTNRFQVGQLLNTVEEIMKKNQGGCYTNEMLQLVEAKIQQQEEGIRLESPDMPQEEVRQRAKSKVANFLKKAAGITTGVLLGALLGVPVMIAIVVNALIEMGPSAAAAVTSAAAAVTSAATAVKQTVSVVAAVEGVSASSAAVGVAAVGVAPGVAAAGVAAAGAVAGACVGYCAADEADSVGEAAQNTAKAICKSAVKPCITLINKVKQQLNKE